ncbi:MAG TPA: signal peptidase II [Spirochaetia bacterium]
MKPLKGLLIVAIVLLVVGCDQASKHVARVRLSDGGVTYLAGGHIALHYVENEGAFLSLGERMPRAARLVVFVAFPLLVLAALIVVIARRGDLRLLMLVGFSLLLGGGLGNLIDRIFRGGRVSDFVYIVFGRPWTGIFNLADLAIMAGCLLLLISPGWGRSSSRGASTGAPRD